MASSYSCILGHVMDTFGDTPPLWPSTQNEVKGPTMTDLREGGRSEEDLHFHAASLEGFFPQTGPGPHTIFPSTLLQTPSVRFPPPFPPPFRRRSHPVPSSFLFPLSGTRGSKHFPSMQSHSCFFAEETQPWFFSRPTPPRRVLSAAFYPPPPCGSTPRCASTEGGA